MEVILNATQWMEEKYRDVPNGKIAAMIALHYLMLAIRSDHPYQPQLIEEHIARALHWWELASSDQCWSTPGETRTINK